MRRMGRPSEIGRLTAPVVQALDAAWQKMHWWIAAMAILYTVSGITVVKSDEVAVVLRWGRLVGATPALQQHGPGLLFAFPRPVDRVVRVPVKHVWEIGVNTLSVVGRNNAEEDDVASYLTLDPLTQGYALTGDQNIVRVAMAVRYRVRDPAEWAFYGPPSEDILRVEAAAAMVRSLGEMGVDRVLADGRKSLIATATRRAQAGLDESHSGLELSSLELTRLAPPTALAGAFDAVQSAYHRRGDQTEGGPGVRGNGAPSGAGDSGGVDAVREGRHRRRPGGGSWRGGSVSGARSRVSRQSGGDPRAPLPGRG